MIFRRLRICRIQFLARTIRVRGKWGILALLLVGLGVGFDRSPALNLPPSGDYDELVAGAVAIVEQIEREPRFDRIEEAEESLRWAITLDPERTDALETLGRLHESAIYWLRTNPKKKRMHALAARDAFARLVEMDALNVRSRIKLIKAHGALDEFGAMHEHLRTVLHLLKRYDLEVRLGDLAPHTLADATIIENDIGILLETGELDAISSIAMRSALADLYVDEGRLGDAKSLMTVVASDYDEWIAENGNRFYWGCPYENLGNIYAQTGAVEKSLAYFKKHADVSIVQPEKQIDTAIRCYRAAEFDCALEYVSRVARDAGDEPMVAALYSLALLGVNRKDDAKQVFEGIDIGKSAAWAHAPSADGRTVAYGHWLLANRRFDEAKKQFLLVINAVSVSRLLFRHDIASNSESIAGFFYEMAYLGMAWIRTFENGHAEALRINEAILTENPDHLLALLGKGTSLFGLGKMSNARQTYLSVLARDPDNVQALNQLGLIALRQGRLTDAKKRFDTATESAGATFACPYTGLGMFYLARGDMTRAKESFEHAVRTVPDRGYHKFNALARIYEREGRTGAARDLLRQSLEHYPNQVEATRILQEIDASGHDQGIPD